MTESNAGTAGQTPEAQEPVPEDLSGPPEEVIWVATGPLTYVSADGQSHSIQPGEVAEGLPADSVQILADAKHIVRQGEYQASPQEESTSHTTTPAEEAKPEGS